jgi:hypothetical protein
MWRSGVCSIASEVWAAPGEDPLIAIKPAMNGAQLLGYLG